MSPSPSEPEGTTYSHEESELLLQGKHWTLLFPAEERLGRLEHPRLVPRVGRDSGAGPRRCWAGSSGCSQHRDSPQLLPAALSHGCIWGVGSSASPTTASCADPPARATVLTTSPHGWTDPSLPLPTPDTVAAPPSPICTLRGLFPPGTLLESPQCYPNEHHTPVLP